MPKPQAITLTPTALDRNGISASETLAATRLDFLINGALSTGYDRNGIATSQTPSSGTAMTLDGAGGLEYTSRKGVYILIYGASDETGRTFTVVGKDSTGGILTEAITGPDAGLIVLGSTRFYTITSVTPDAATAGAIEVGTNGYVSLSTPQHVAIYSAGNDSGDTFTVTGENRYGDAVTDSITGANAGTSTTQTVNFSRVDRVTNSSTTAGAAEVGIDALCESQWYILNYRGHGFNVALGAVLSSDGNLTYDVEHTFDNVFASDFTEAGATVFNHDTIASKTVNFDSNYTNPPTAVRIAITAYTAGGVTLNIIQSGGAD